MTEYRQIPFLTAAVLFFTLLSPVSAANGQRRIQLTGVVNDGLVPDDLPRIGIPGATIRLYSLNQVLQTKSDKAGHFQFTNLPDDSYDLEISKSGFKTKSIEDIRITSSSELSYDVTLRVNIPECAPLDSVAYEPGERDTSPIITGKVFDVGREKPLSRVEVRLFHITNKPLKAFTNDRGEFRFFLLDGLPGRYFVQTVKPGYRTMISQQFWVTRRGRTVVTMEQIKNGTIVVCE